MTVRSVSILVLRTLAVCRFHFSYLVLLPHWLCPVANYEGTNVEIIANEMGVSDPRGADIFYSRRPFPQSEAEILPIRIFCFLHHHKSIHSTRSLQILTSVSLGVHHPKFRFVQWQGAFNWRCCKEPGGNEPKKYHLWHQVSGFDHTWYRY